MGTITPLTFAYLRILGAAIVLNLLPHERVALSRVDAWHLVLYAVLAVVINQTFFLGGLALTNAHIAAILITTVPVFTLAVAILLGRERATATKIGGISLAAAGALIIVIGEGVQGSRRELGGILLLIGNCLSFSFYLVLSKPMMARVSARQVIARMFGAASVILLPIAAVSLLREPWAAITPRAWAGLAFVIAGPTVLAYLLNAWALRHADSSLVAAYSYLQPVLTAALAAVFLGERIRVMAVMAALMIFAGVALAGSRRRIITES